MDEDLNTMKGISCNKVKKLTNRYSQNLLAPDWAEGVEDHLSHCPDCHKEYQETQEILGLLSQDRLPDPGPEFWKGMSSRIMTQVRQIRPEPVRIPWTKKIWGYPFGWPGHAWATALILILLTPVIIYTTHYKNQPQPPVQELVANDWRWEMGIEAFSPALETLSSKESIRLGKRLISRLSGDLPKQTQLTAEDELQGDISHSLEGLDKEDLDLLIKKMQTGGSAGLKEEGRYVS
jgi:hypothetical protein